MQLVVTLKGAPESGLTLEDLAHLFGMSVVGIRGLLREPHWGTHRFNPTTGARVIPAETVERAVAHEICNRGRSSRLVESSGPKIDRRKKGFRVRDGFPPKITT